MIDVGLATAPGCNAVVHAAAGTGKTWLLTSRIIRLLLSGAAPGAILAITFTRKAAGEIYERISERLMAMAQADDTVLPTLLREVGAEPDHSTMVRARNLLETLLSTEQELRTTTFHAFCQDLLRRFPIEAEVPPGFEVAESDLEYFESAWQDLDQELLRGQDPQLAAAMDELLARCTSVAAARGVLHDFLDHRSDWWAYTEGVTDPVEHATDALRVRMELPQQAEYEDIYCLIYEFEPDLRRYAELLRQHPARTSMRRIEDLMAALDSRAAPPQAFELVRDTFLTRDGGWRTLEPSKALRERLGDAATDELVRLHDSLVARVAAAEDLRRRLDGWNASRVWYRCGHRLLEHYQRIKAEHRVLDFADLEWKTYCLLNRSGHAEWIQYKLDQRVDHLLVDEFQDTNPTQWRLLRPLLEEMAAGRSDRQRSVFLVGDEKQSIYRFRRADPALFHAAHHWLESHAAAQTFRQHVSWRSSPAVLHFVNLVFGGAEGGSAEAHEFGLPDFSEHDTRHGDLWGCVEVLPLVRRGPDEPGVAAFRNPLQQPRFVAEDRRHFDEGQLIAARIKGLIGLEIRDGRQVRALHHGDIMILLRDRTHADAYESALLQAGIPYLGVGRGGFGDCLEVQDLAHLLRILVAAYDDLALASALRSPVFAADSADLVTLALQPEPVHWYDRLLALPDDALTPPLARARQLLPRWRTWIDRIPVHDLLDRIYSEGNVTERFLAATPEYLKPRVAANLTRFLELALEVDSGRYPSLAHFLARLASNPEETAVASTPGADRRVRLLTVHAAKGLEAPVVFVANAARDPGGRDGGPRALVEWPVELERPRHFALAGRAAALDAVTRSILERQRRAQWREEANLLYVALTRAKQALFVSGCEPARGGRGWYGFIETRLRAAEQAGRAARLGLKLKEIEGPGEPTAFGAIIEHGEHPMHHGAASSAEDAGSVSVDETFTRPLAPVSEVPEIHPSAMADGDFATGHSGSGPEGASARQRGIVLHRMLDLLTKVPDRKTAETTLRGEFGVLPAADIERWWQEACAVVDDPGLRDWFDPANYELARNEVPLLYWRDGQAVHGVIDRLVLRAGEVILIDYKTHAGATPAELARLATPYVPALRLYGEGVRRLWPARRPRLVLLFTACRRAIEVTPAEP